MTSETLKNDFGNIIGLRRHIVGIRKHIAGKRGCFVSGDILSPMQCLRRHFFQLLPKICLRRQMIYIHYLYLCLKYVAGDRQYVSGEKISS